MHTKNVFVTVVAYEDSSFIIYDFIEMLHNAK